MLRCVETARGPSRRLPLDARRGGPPFHPAPVAPPAHLTAATSHSLMVASALPAANSVPSPLNATEVTDFVNPPRVALAWPVLTSQSLTVWSPLPDASIVPSPRKATA